jgi:hypothetical protein
MFGKLESIKQDVQYFSQRLLPPILLFSSRVVERINSDQEATLVATVHKRTDQSTHLQ